MQKSEKLEERHRISDFLDRQASELLLNQKTIYTKFEKQSIAGILRESARQIRLGYHVQTVNINRRIENV